MPKKNINHKQGNSHFSNSHSHYLNRVEENPHDSNEESSFSNFFNNISSFFSSLFCIFECGTTNTNSHHHEAMENHDHVFYYPSYVDNNDREIIPNHLNNNHNSTNYDQYYEGMPGWAQNTLEGVHNSYQHLKEEFKDRFDLS